ncbi:MAG: hypothetical protein Kow0090_14850 [Myxococcota bacterium]
MMRDSKGLVFMGLIALSIVFGCGSEEVQQKDEKNLVGGACTADANCETNLCIVNQGYCTQNCDANVANSCPEKFKCSFTELSEGRRSFYCVRDPLQQNCESDGDCPTGHKCDIDGTKTCYIFAERSLCAPCDNDKQCGEGNKCLAIQHTGGATERVCGRACSSDNPCPKTYYCGQGQCYPCDAENCDKSEDRGGSCSLGKKACSPCSANNECGGPNDFCVYDRMTAKGYCATDCSRGQKCDEGFTCKDLSRTMGLGVKQCVPKSGICEGGFCNFDEECGPGRLCKIFEGDETGRCEPTDDGNVCEPCLNNEQCGGSDDYCVRLKSDAPNFSEFPDAEPFCSASCTNGKGARDQTMCPPFFECVKLDTAANTPAPYQCIPMRGSCTKGMTPIGGDCSQEKGKDCMTGLCLQIGVNSICTASCRGNPDICPRGLSCTEIKLSVGGETETREICAPEGGKIGDDCSPGSPPCASGWCLDMTVSRICTQSCYSDAECPSNYSCRRARVGSEQINVCFPSGGGNVGDPCPTGPDNCATQYCIQKSSGNVCTIPCATDDHCKKEKLCEGRSEKDCEEAIRTDWYCDQVVLAGGDEGTGVQQNVCVPVD